MKALRTASIEDVDGWVDFSDFTQRIEDPSGQMSEHDAFEKLQKMPSIVPESAKSPLKFGQTYWLLFALTNSSSQKRHFVMRMESGVFVSAYYWEKNKFEPLPAFRWEGKKISPSYQYLEMEEQKRDVFLAQIKCTTHSRESLNLSINTFENVLKNDAGLIHVGGILLGILLILTIYYVVLGSSLKDPLYLHYFFFLISCCVLVVASGSETRYLQLPYMKLLPLSPAYFMILALAAWTQFSKHYLEIPRQIPWMSAPMNIASGVVLASILLLWMNTGHGCIIIVAFIAILTIATAAVVSLGYPSSRARYFLLANAGLMFAGGYFLYGDHQNLPFTEKTYHILQGALLLQVCLMALGMGRRLSDLQKEKEAALSSDLEHQKHAVELHQQTTRSYARFVPMEFFHLLDKQNILDVQLGDARQHNMAVLFSDIRSFSTLCERFSSADSFRMLNEYLGEMGPVIRRSHGFIDKYIGDAIMALFPNSADHAVTAAIEMVRHLKNLNASREKRNEPPVAIGIGVHTGTLMLGTVGEEERMEGTVISDVVNIASRLEQLTRPYNIPIIISQEVVSAFKTTTFAYRFLGETRLRGKTEVTRFYEVFQADQENERFLKSKTKAVFEQAVRCHLDGDHATAAKLFQEILSENPSDNPAQYYLSESHLTLSANPHYKSPL
ncbi:MAG: adenylate/guanylate cyclase domain-containing protein [Verrucomicrobiota bacterium]